MYIPTSSKCSLVRDSSTIYTLSLRNACRLLELFSQGHHAFAKTCTALVLLRLMNSKKLKYGMPATVRQQASALSLQGLFVMDGVTTTIVVGESVKVGMDESRK